MNNFIKQFRKAEGTALFLTLMMLSTILIVTLGAASVISSGIVMSRTQERSTKAFFAAEAGAERSLWEVRKNAYALPQENQANLFLNNLGNNSNYAVNYATSSESIRFTSAGYYLGTRRSVEINYPNLNDLIDCTADCAGKLCGDDDGCGGTCPATCSAQPGCYAIAPENTVATTGSCCVGTCYECDNLTTWSGTRCGVPKALSISTNGNSAAVTCFLQENNNILCRGWEGTHPGIKVNYTNGDAIKVSVGDSTTCMIKTDGNVYCFGSNASGQGVNYSPVGGVTATDVRVGGFHTCVLLSNNNVHCYGGSGVNFGQVIDYNNGDAMAVSAAGINTCVLKTDGNVVCFGNNLYGQSTGYTGGDAIALSGNIDIHCVLTSNGDVHCWGDNSQGAVINYTGHDAIDVSTSGQNTCIIKTDHNGYCFGSNMNNMSENYNGGDAIKVFTGRNDTCFLKSNGSAHCQGWDWSPTPDNDPGADYTAG